MSFANPTPLRIGMTGNFTGRNYRVVGRVVMGTEDSGEIYYWNEFNLEDDSGECATLVYEETERGGEWRLFILFDSQIALSAADAATRGVGDSLDFGEGPYRITLVGISRVYHIEGRVPEGVEAGDVANYFNAESGRKMVVVSWTGDEVEFYRGINIASATVGSAFNVDVNFGRSATNEPAGFGSGSFGSQTETASRWIVRAIAIGIAIAALAMVYSAFRSKRSSLRIFPAPATRLSAGTDGILEGKHYRIAGHNLVRIEEVNLRFERHEFQLRDDEGTPALLVLGSKPGAKDWVLFTPLHPLIPMTPLQAGGLKVGQTVNVDGIVAPVSELFCATARAAADSPIPAQTTGTTMFGFSGRTGPTLLLARWTEAGIAVYRGKMLREDAAASFKSIAPAEVH